MDGTLAIIFIIASLTEMTFSDCATGCLSRDPATPRISLQRSQVFFQENDITKEYYAGYDMRRRYGPYQPTFGASYSDQGDFWIGAGAKWSTQRISNGPLFFEASLMPGFYSADQGPDLGGNLQFRSAVGGGFEFNSGATLTVTYDHRSNADTQSYNPGLETLGIRYAFVFN